MKKLSTDTMHFELQQLFGRHNVNTVSLFTIVKTKIMTSGAACFFFNLQLSDALKTITKLRRCKCKAAGLDCNRL